MNSKFVVAGQLLRMLWLELEDTVMAQLSCNDWSTREFFEIVKLQICRTIVDVRINL